MSTPAVAGDRTRRPRPVLRALARWHDERPRADLTDARGWLMGALVAATFFWMSNPVVFIPSFYLALGQALIWTKVVVVVSLVWLRFPRVPWPWLAFVALAYLSQLWTRDDFHTDVSDIVYLELTTLAVLVAANSAPRVVAWGLGAGGCAVVGLSLYAYAHQVPGSVNVYYGGIAGVGSNENILSYVLAVSLAAVLAIGLPEGLLARLAWLAMLVVHAYGLLRANAGTGYLTSAALVVTVLVVLAWPRLRARGTRFLLGGLGAAALTGVGVLLLVTVVLGKELATFSGRVPFWGATIANTLDTAPVLGSGWGAVWEHPWDPTPANEVSLAIYARAGYALPHGHNFFVDVLPELGLVGVLLALVMVAYAIREVHRCGLRAGSPDPLTGRLVLLVLVSLLVSGMTEPMLTVPIGWWTLALVVALPRQRLWHFWRPDGGQRFSCVRTSGRGRRAAR